MIGRMILRLEALAARLSAAFRQSRLRLARHTSRRGLAAID
jgi:hypothetical protein